MGRNIKRKDLKYETKKQLYDFQQYETRPFSDSIYTVKTNIDEAEMVQRNLLKDILKFNNKSR